MEGANELEKRIIEVFDAFDHGGNGTVDVREIGTVIRALGCVPSEEDLQEIIVQIEDTHVPGCVELQKFLPFMVKIVEENKLQAASPETLLQAFQRMDPDGQGLISRDTLAQHMMQEGEVFSQEEVDEMMGIAVDPESGHIPYEYYINQLMVPADRSMYALYEPEVEQEVKRMSILERAKSLTHIFASMSLVMGAGEDEEGEEGEEDGDQLAEAEEAEVAEPPRRKSSSMKRKSTTSLRKSTASLRKSTASLRKSTASLRKSTAKPEEELK